MSLGTTYYILEYKSEYTSNSGPLSYVAAIEGKDEVVIGKDDEFMFSNLNELLELLYEDHDVLTGAIGSLNAVGKAVVTKTTRSFNDPDFVRRNYPELFI